jgi:hypothetical protein
MYLTSPGDNGNMVSWGSGSPGSRFSVLHQVSSSLDVIGEGDDATSGYSLPANTWTHVVVTYDTTDLRFYVNGSLVATVQPGAVFFTTDASLPLRIGVNVVNNEYFGGQLDEVRVYDRALTPGDVSQLYAYSGAAAAVAVPTLAEWSKALMAAALLGVGALYVRRRNAGPGRMS